MAQLLVMKRTSCKINLSLGAEMEKYISGKTYKVFRKYNKRRLVQPNPITNRNNYE